MTALNRQPLRLKAIKAALHLLERTGWRKPQLEAKALLEAARTETGLDDFGGETFLDPLSRLVDSCRDEARLNSLGKIAFKSDVVQLLVNRLLLQRASENSPGIRQRPIIAPIFITGLPRTGTTLLHGLLAQDTNTFRAPATWEVMFPVAGSKDSRRKQIKEAERRLSLFDWIVPEFRKIHPISAHLPQECIVVLSHSFLSDQFDAMFNIPTYQAWLEQQDMRPAYVYHKQFLQHLLDRRPARHLLLKAPSHMRSIEALLAVYPDAQIVQTHREPVDVLASAASLQTVLRSTFSDFVDPAAIGRELARFWDITLVRFRDARAKAPANFVLDVSHSELSQEPIAVVRRLYHELGHRLTPAAEYRMHQFLAANPRFKHGRHSYTPAVFGLDSAEIYGRFSWYRKNFGLLPGR
jgi:hypothetical protein